MTFDKTVAEFHDIQHEICQSDPGSFRGFKEELPKNASLVVVDEIQKLPSLLDEVQLLMDTRRIRFLLTGCKETLLKRSESFGRKSKNPVFASF
jgi:predicted AAA+ superfamily ATPase